MDICGGRFQVRDAVVVIQVMGENVEKRLVWDAMIGTVNKPDLVVGPGNDLACRRSVLQAGDCFERVVLLVVCDDYFPEAFLLRLPRFRRVASERPIFCKIIAKGF